MIQYHRKYIISSSKKKVKYSMARSLQVGNLLQLNVGSIISTIACRNLLKQTNGELLVAVDHNQLRTMASETVYLIDWSYPPPSWAAPPERLVHIINKCSLSGNRPCNRSMRCHHIAYAATQGILYPFYIQ